jgi:mannose/cellobiose epimerase-like protein (N-acyl-D-glucosamine 2-epimerase family)
MLPDLDELHAQLRRWLIDAACPLWQARGIDAVGGGFEETLDADAMPLHEARRARVQPRQVHAFAQAAKLGWNGDAATIAQRGMAYFCRVYQREDGLFRTLASAGGGRLDDRVLLYDQAFALLGYGAAAGTPQAALAQETCALRLRAVIERQFSASGGGYLSEAGVPDARESNPHMHLLEACLSWAEIGADESWQRCAAELVALALDRMVRKDSGAIGETYTTEWLPVSEGAGRRIEPGHQFEWAWLLMRSARRHDPRCLAVALRLIEIAEARGVHDGYAVNALNDDFTVLDARARLWPQTERLKATALAATITGVNSYLHSAHQAAECVLKYLGTTTPGLWFDMRLASGEFASGASPASSFYHLVSAINALDGALRQHHSGSSDRSGPT